MPRFNPNSISYPKQDELIEKFCAILAKLRTKEKMKDFFKDLLNRQERLMLVRRILIAEMLLEDKSYREIRAKYRVGMGTISRVERWLHFGRGGIEKALKKK